MLNVKLDYALKAREFFTLHLKKLVSLSYHLMLMHDLAATARLDEIISAILAAASLTTNRRNNVASSVEQDGVARQLLHLTDEESLIGRFETACLGRLAHHAVGKHDHVATLKYIAVHPIHYHSVTLLQLRRKPTCGHREYSENVSAHHPYEQQCHTYRDDVFDCYFQILLDIVDKLEQSIPANA